MRPQIGIEHFNSLIRTPLSDIKNHFYTLLSAGTFVAASAVSVSAQATTPIPQVVNTTNGSGFSTVTLTGLSTTTTSDATVVLNLFGDLNGGFTERLDVRFDGVLIARITNGAACSTFTRTITVPQATLTPLIADGQIVVNYIAGPGVNNDVCGPPGSTAFQSSGSLAFAGVGGGPGGGAGSTASDSVARFLDNRARTLVQNQPDVVRFVDGRTAGQFNAEVTQGNGDLDIQSSAKLPFWAAVQGSWTDSSIGDQSYVLGSVGGHTYVGSNAIVGAMLQFDFSDRSETGVADTEGTGWLVGPYFAAQLGAQPLYLDGRFLYGRTDNEITPFGAPTDDFDGERWLGMLGLEGRVQANRFTIFPGVDVSHVQDKQDGYVDSTATPVASQTVEQTEIAFSLDFETPLPVSGADMMLTWGASGIWSNTDGSGPSASIVQFDDGWRGRLDLGFRYENGNGLKSDANAYVDGLGDSGPESFGVSLGLSFAF